MSSEQRYSALVVGATGLVGREIVRQLAADPACSRVVVLARREPPPELRGGKVESVIADFDWLEQHRPALRVSHAFCALGTTIKRAGSQERFRQVDHDYPLAVGRLALREGARHYLLVSALGANPRSRAFYSRVKGDVEEGIRQLGFASLTVARPSLLLGERDEFRLGEEIGKRLAFLVPRRYQPVQARDVAGALVAAARENRAGVRVIESREMHGAGA